MLAPPPTIAARDRWVSPWAQPNLQPDFPRFLRQREEERWLAKSVTDASEAALAQVWDNPDDAGITVFEWPQSSILAAGRSGPRPEPPAPEPGRAFAARRGLPAAGRIRILPVSDTIA